MHDWATLMPIKAANSFNGILCGTITDRYVGCFPLIWMYGKEAMTGIHHVTIVTTVNDGFSG